MAQTSDLKAKTSMKIKNMRIQKDIVKLSFSALLFGGLMVACVKEDVMDDLSAPKTGPEADIRVGASVSQPKGTRAYFGSDNVEVVDRGIFYMSYPEPSDKSSFQYSEYKIAKVTFGVEEAPTTGFASFNDGTKQKELKWKNVYGEGDKSVQFFLHNMDPAWSSIVFQTGSNASNSSSRNMNQKYVFTSDCPFVASPLDKTNGENDLLSSGTNGPTGSGYQLGSNKDSEISFNLYHRMSLLKVKVEVYPSDDNYKVDLSNVSSVTISNIYPKLKSFNPYYPNNFTTNLNGISFSDRFMYAEVGDQRQDLVMIGSVSGDALGITEKGLGGSVNRTWENVTRGDDDDPDVYDFSEFVVPPQDFDPMNRPRITIIVPKFDVTQKEEDKGEFYEYSAYLPTVMYEADENGDFSYGTPIQTAFNSGYELHLTATINSPDTELIFAPVQVKAWGGWATYKFTTKQAGIYNGTDFQNLIQAYSSPSAFTLEKFGYQKNGTFVFQFWGNLILDYESIFGKMPANPEFPYEFNFKNYFITIQKDGEEYLVLDEDNDGPQTLYEIMNGTYKPKD